MTQLTVSIEDVSMLDQIKQAISLIRGVSSVTLKRRRKTSMDRAIEDIEQGRVYKDDEIRTAHHWRVQAEFENLQEARPADAGTVGCRGQVAARRETRREVSGSSITW